MVICKYLNQFEMDGIGQLPIFTDYRDEKRLEFGKIIPIPEDLTIYYDFLTGPKCIYAYFIEYPESPLKDFMMKRIENEDLTDVVKDSDGWELFLREGRAFIQNYVRYGYISSWDWCWQHWNTMHNAKKCVVFENSISFETIGGVPFSIAERLSEQYPDKELCHSFLIKGVGLMKGSVTYLNGHVKKQESDYSSEY